GVAVGGGGAGGGFQDGARDGHAAALAAHEDVGAGDGAGVQPEVVRAGHARGEVVVRGGVLAPEYLPALQVIAADAGAGRKFALGAAGCVARRLPLAVETLRAEPLVERGQPGVVGRLSFLEERFQPRGLRLDLGEPLDGALRGADGAAVAAE